MQHFEAIPLTCAQPEADPLAGWHIGEESVPTTAIFPFWKRPRRSGWARNRPVIDCEMF